MSDRRGARHKQLPLSIGLRESAHFANFVAGENRQLVEAVEAMMRAARDQERCLYVWGGEGVGKSHLLQAACHAAAEAGQTAIYLPLSQADQFAPQMLEGMEQMAVVAIDDIDAIAGDRAWETAIFHLYNRMRDESEGALIVAATTPLASSPLQLADLRSRLAWGLVFQLQGLDDDGKLAALRRAARGRGLDLSDEVANYLLRHYRRDLAALMALLEKLDEVSLVAQRRLTIPFVKSVIESE